MSAQKSIVLLVTLSLILISQTNCIASNELGQSIPVKTDVLASTCEYSTFFGGSDNDQSTRVTTDSEDNIILKFVTSSTDLPTSDTSFQPDFGGGINDGFIAKFSPQGELIFATYLGGSGSDHIVRVVADDENNIYIVGSTYSSDFHTTEDAFQTENLGNQDGYITKLSPNGTLLYSSYFGGAGGDRIQHIMFHENGSILIEGYTSSAGFATAGAYQTLIAGSADTFVAKLNSDLDTILMFTYYGGSSIDWGWRVEIDSDYNFIICGETQSRDLPTTPNAICSTYSGSTDAFIAKISSSGGELLYATYLGGSQVDFGGGVCVDSSDNFYITGAASSGFTMLNDSQDLHHGGMDFFAAKFTEDCDLVFFEIIGGNKTDLMWDALLDNEENLIIVGTTYSDDYPIVNAVQQERAGRNDACVTVLSPNGTDIILSTYIGGSGNEKGEGIAVQSDGLLIISGYTPSDDFPVSSNAYQPNRTGINDAFLYRIDPLGIPPVTTETSETPSEPPQTPEDNLPLVITLSSVAIIAVVVTFLIVLKRK